MPACAYWGWSDGGEKKHKTGAIPKKLPSVADIAKNGKPSKYLDLETEIPLGVLANGDQQVMSILHRLRAVGI